MLLFGQLLLLGQLLLHLCPQIYLLSSVSVSCEKCFGELRELVIDRGVL